jgi:Rne/Rng family ribonuclease
MADQTYNLLIDHVPGETRAALMEGEQLIDIHYDRALAPNRAAVKANDIYLGRVVNVVPALQAAFVDIATGQNAFLPVNATDHDDITKAVHEGQRLMVQIRKEPKDDKGALLSCKIDLAGAHSVLTPGRPGINISRKFKNMDARDQLKTTLQNALPPESGVIVRTSGEEIPPALLIEEIQDLLDSWQSLHNLPMEKEGLLYSAQSFFSSLFERYPPAALKQIIVDGIDAYLDLKRLGIAATPHEGQTPLFEAWGVEEQIEAANATTLPLADGGSLIIEPTAALIAIDVNMGERQDGRDGEKNKLTTNLAAINELKRQIHLRNLSGQILIDFISLKNKKHKAQLHDAVTQAFSDTRTTVHGFTRMGLCEITRTRQGPSLHELLNSPDSTFYQLIRRLAKGTQVKTIPMGANLYHFWQNEKTSPTRHWLFERLGYKISAVLDEKLPAYNFTLEAQ